MDNFSLYSIALCNRLQSAKYLLMMTYLKLCPSNKIKIISVDIVSKKCLLISKNKNLNVLLVRAI